MKQNSLETMSETSDISSCSPTPETHTCFKVVTSLTVNLVSSMQQDYLLLTINGSKFSWFRRDRTNFHPCMGRSSCPMGIQRQIFSFLSDPLCFAHARCKTVDKTVNNSFIIYSIYTLQFVLPPFA